uniref:Uncharacterized protein n=1 Tax=Heterorhabditis bacteriophora TaxID=37862 RepID=A0A1I7X294_HETBA
MSCPKVETADNRTQQLSCLHDPTSDAHVEEVAYC